MDIEELTKEQKHETIRYIIGEVSRFSGLFDEDYYELEVRRYCATHFKRNPGKKYAHELIEALILKKWIEQDNGRIERSKEKPTF